MLSKIVLHVSKGSSARGRAPAGVWQWPSFSKFSRPKQAAIFSSIATDEELAKAKTNVAELLKESERIHFSAFHYLYLKRFGYPLENRKLGYKNIVEFVRLIPGVVVEDSQKATNFPYITLDDTSSLSHTDQGEENDINDGKPSSNLEENGVGIVLVDTQAKLEEIMRTCPFDLSHADEKSHDAVVAVDCKGEPDDLLFLQTFSGTTAYVFDCAKLGPTSVCQALSPLLAEDRITTVFYDVHRSIAALVGEIPEIPLSGVFDAQLAMEMLTGNYHLDFAEMMDELDLSSEHPLNNECTTAVFASRPLDKDALKYAVNDVSLLIKAHRVIVTKLKEIDPSAIEHVKKATLDRFSKSVATKGLRQICFDAANGYRIASRELLSAIQPGNIHLPSKPVIKPDIEALLHLIPNDCKAVVESNATDIVDIVLDRDRLPHIWSNKGGRVFIRDDKPIGQEDIQHVEDSIGYFGTDNRATLEGQIHRVSCIRNRDGDITGLTLRVGCYVEDVATLISDILSSPRKESILILGGPGSGKTTILRDVTRILAETQNVCVVDKSNEIGGDSDSPHPCIGHARRLMVPELDKQADVMIECVQNHTPQCIIVDEIGRTREVFAAETCKNRGVRLVATAHGDLRTLVENKALNKLVGGVETVAIGDAQARRESKISGKQFNKLRPQRAGRPIFDVVIELQSGVHNQCRIIFDPGQAVDDVLEGRRYLAHRRMYDPELGQMSFYFERR